MRREHQDGPGQRERSHHDASHPNEVRTSARELPRPQHEHQQRENGVTDLDSQKDADDCEQPKFPTIQPILARVSQYEGEKQQTAG